MKYRGLDVYKCGPWTQGPVFLQQLRLLEGFELRKLGHNSPQYIHTVIESAKLAFADREAFIGDPDVVDVPLDVLLSAEYAGRQRARIDPRRATPALPEPGDAAPLSPFPKGKGVGGIGRALPVALGASDTSYVCAVDRWGNAFSATPSDGFGGPIVPGVGMVSLSGGRRRAINVVVDTDKLASYGLSVEDVRLALVGQNLEVPGGIIETGEPPEEAALRELREETGYAGHSARLLGAQWPNPAMQSNRLFTYLVENARHVAAPQPDPFERIVVEPRPLVEIPAMIRTGVIRHSLVIASLALYGIAAADR